MDKKLKRQIGYLPPNQKVISKRVHPLENSEVIPNAIPLLMNDIISTELSKVKKIVDWIKSHPEFKWGAMCDKIGMDKGNFQRTLNSSDPKIKIELISPIEDFLKNYGYAK